MKKPKLKAKTEIYPYGGALNGAISGAGIGMEFGPWGALAGAGIGAGLGYLQEQKQNQQDKDYLNQQNLNKINSTQINNMRNSPLVEGAPQAAYKNGGIHIKPSHKGRFTAYKQRTGKTTEEALHSKNPHVRQMANFARNAAKWKHEDGGIHQDFLNDAEVYNYNNGGVQGFTLTPSDYFPNGGTKQKYVTPLANLNNFYPPIKKQIIAPTSKKYNYGGYHIPKGVYANGGMSIDNENPNAEIENEELMRSPNGSTMQVDGNSHAQGGIPVNIPNGTQIYSDRLKDPESKKTFAKLAEKYKVNKEEKVLDNKKSSSLARSTAELNMQLKQQKLSEIFNKQELLKKSKVNEYAKKLGVDISKLNINNEDSGSHYQRPEDHPEEIQYAYGGMKYPSGGIIDDYPLDEVDTTSDIIQSGFDREYSKLPSQQPSMRAKPSWQDAAIMAGNLLGPTYALATNKAPETYDIAKPEFKQYNPSNALQIADQENRMLREQARVNSGGNSSAYLSSLAGLQSNLTRNKAGIQQQYDQMNTSTYNQAQLPIAQMQTQRNIDRQHDVTANRDFKTGNVGQIGTVVAQGALGNKATQQDMDYLNWLNQQYPVLRNKYNTSSNR